MPSPAADHPIQIVRRLYSMGEGNGSWGDDHTVLSQTQLTCAINSCKREEILETSLLR